MANEPANLPVAGTLSGVRPPLAQQTALSTAELSVDEVRQLLNGAAVGIVKVSREGQIIYANTQARRQFYGTEMDPLGKDIKDFGPYLVRPDGSPFPYEEFPAVKCLETGESQFGELIGVKLPSEPVYWVIIKADPWFDPRTGETEAVVITVSESPEPSHVSEKLDQTEERYRLLVENSPDSLVVHSNGTIMFINAAGVKLWAGSSREDFIGREIMDFIHPQDRISAARRIQAAMSGGTTPLITQRHRRLDGQSIYVEVTGTPCIYRGRRCVQVIFRDVTERRRIDRLVRRQREMLGLFFKRLPVLVGIFGPDGRPKTFNREWKRVIGWPQELSVEQLLVKLYPDTVKRKEALEYLTAAPPGWQDFSCRVRGGRTRILSWANIVLSSGNRIGLALDVTERREIEEELRKSKVDLGQRVAERTEELTRKNQELRHKQRFMERTLAVHERDRKLVAYEIHDTILQEVIGSLMYIDTMYENLAGTEGLNIAPLEQAGKLLRRCIDEARQMISGLRPPIIDEQGIVGAIDYLVSELNANGMSIRYTHSIETERFNSDLETTIFRIVQEALANVQRHSQSRHAVVDIQQHENVLRISVVDRGIGFDLESVGDRHFGLEGIRERARLAGGWATFHSSIGQGTEVIVELPAVSEGDSSE